MNGLKKIFFIFKLAIISSLLIPSCNKQTKQVDQPLFSVTISDHQEVKESAIQESQIFTIYISRQDKEMIVVDGQNQEIIKTSIGIGRGGLKQKINMMDLVTPTGELEVDLILYQDKNFSRVSSDVQEKYLNSQFQSFVDDQEGLEKLFFNMNSIDFDGNGKADNSYGIAYIGLTSVNDNNVVTGPKMRLANWQGGNNTPYWFSIALHGTPNENKDLGAANSGGCIHVSQEVLSEIIEKELITIDTKVIIND